MQNGKIVSFHQFVGSILADHLQLGHGYVWMTKKKKPGIDSVKRTDERSACFLPRAKRVEVDKLTNFYLK